MGGGFRKSKESIDAMEKYSREIKEDMDKYGEKKVWSETMHTIITIPNHPDPSKYERKV